jgi:nucleoside-diphosphate-sugar epimerase
MMKVLVTGATGKVGANLVRRLVSEGVPTRAMLMPADPLAGKLAALPDLDVVQGDLLRPETLDRVVHGVTHIVHLAGQLPGAWVAPETYFDVNAFGTFRLLAATVRERVRLERFVLASTDGVYRPGAPPSIPLAEDVPALPGDYYGTSKWLAEVILRNHAVQYDLPHSIVRFATVVSPDETPAWFRYSRVLTVLGKAKLGKADNLWPLFDGRPDLAAAVREQVPDGAGNPAVCLTGPDGEPWTIHLADVRDIVEGITLALRHPEALGGVFNIAGPHPTSYRDGATTVAERFGLPVHDVRLPVTWRLEIDTSRARRVLGFAPQYDFPAALTDGLRSNSDNALYIPAR